MCMYLVESLPVCLSFTFWNCPWPALVPSKELLRGCAIHCCSCRGFECRKIQSFVDVWTVKTRDWLSIMLDWLQPHRCECFLRGQLPLSLSLSPSLFPRSLPRCPWCSRKCPGIPGCRSRRSPLDHPCRFVVVGEMWAGDEVGFMHSVWKIGFTQSLFQSLLPTLWL